MEKQKLELQNIENINFILEYGVELKVSKNDIVEMNIDLDDKKYSKKGLEGEHRKITAGNIEIKPSSSVKVKYFGDYEADVNVKFFDSFIGDSEIIYIDVKYADGNSEKILVPYEEMKNPNTKEVVGLKECSSSELNASGNLCIYMGAKSKFKPMK